MDTKMTYGITVLIAGGLAVLATIAFFIYAFLFTKADHKKSGATIFNTFPNEMTDLSRGVKSAFPSILAGLVGVFSGVAFVMTFLGMLYGKGGELTYSTIFLLAFGIGAGIDLFLATFIPFSLLKISLSCMIALIFLEIGVGTFPMVTTTSGTFAFQLNPIVSYVMAGVSLSNMLLMFNPKLNKWDKLQKTEVNGATYWMKPKINWLATTVWYAYLVNGLLVILVMVSALLNVMGA